MRFGLMKVGLNIGINILSKFFVTILTTRILRWFLGDVISRKHQLFLKLVNFLHLQEVLFAWLFQFLYSICIFECIQSVLAAWWVWWDVSDHYCAAIACKWVFEDHCQFATSEWCMMLILIQSSDALLEGEKWLVNFGSINSRLFLQLISMVSSSFTACQVDEWDFAKKFVFPFQANL